MSFRGGQGRGRGRFGGGSRFVKEVPFELFPEIKDFPDAEKVKIDSNFSKVTGNLETFWKSQYYYEEVGKAAKKNEDTEIRKFSDREKKRTKRKAALPDFISISAANFPAELVGNKELPVRKRVRWNRVSEMQKLNRLMDKKFGDDEEEEEEETEKKSDDDEEGDDENPDEEEFSDNGDYEQNEDFDDDEDDFNVVDDYVDEGGIY